MLGRVWHQQKQTESNVMAHKEIPFYGCKNNAPSCVLAVFGARSTIHHNFSALRIPHYSAAKRDTMWKSEEQVCGPLLTRPHWQNEK